MSGVFILLLLLSSVGLLWGLVAPHHIAKAARVSRPVTRKHTGLVFGTLVMLFLVLASLTAPSQSPKSQKVSLTSANSSVPTTQTQTDSITNKQVTSTQSIPFSTQNQNDDSLPKGQTKVIQVGKEGVETLTFKVTYTNGQQTDKTLLSKNVTTQPIDQIVEVGTYVAPTPAPKPKPVSTPSPAPTPTQSCYPLTNGGNCYEPGEYCRETDHGVSGVAGDSKAIVCAYQ